MVGVSLCGRYSKCNINRTNSGEPTPAHCHGFLVDKTLLSSPSPRAAVAETRLLSWSLCPKRIYCCLLILAGNIVLELSKDKHNASLLDRQLVQFQSSVNRVESELSSQIRYLTQVATGQPHEGSTYSARKDCQMALNRAEYAKVKLGELGRTCEVMLEQQWRGIEA
uniref:Mediator of RNA polymerase II transcription subunit 11 n=1 Tax=Scophthalmus maximus TaxID=52904 RepID=A0A8D3CTN1_SCOMX